MKPWRLTVATMAIKALLFSSKRYKESAPPLRVMNDFLHCLMKAAIDLSDGVILASQQINSELAEYVEQSGKPALPFQGEDNYIQVYNEFYEKVLHN